MERDTRRRAAGGATRTWSRCRPLSPPHGRWSALLAQAQPRAASPTAAAACYTPRHLLPPNRRRRQPRLLTQV